MSKPSPAEEVKMVMSIFTGEIGLMKEALQIVCQRLGPVDFISVLMPFDYTKYYEKEMAGQIMRRFVSFESLIRPETLPDIKLFCNETEKALTLSGQRRVNIDPGYISSAHLILATGKGYVHRPYLRDGIYADLTLLYRRKTFECLPWTYPDYGQKAMLMVLSKVREKYLLQKRAQRVQEG